MRMLKLGVTLGVLTLVLSLGNAASEAAGPTKIGDHFAINIDSDLPSEYISVNGDIWTIDHPGASYIAIHFADFRLAPGEYLLITDTGGRQSYVLTGKGKMNAGTFWARHIKGSQAVLEYVRAKETSPGYGFVIDEYAAGYPEKESAEAICGADDKDNAVCYSGSHPFEYSKARAVARLLINGSGLCTGWLVSSNNHLVTNEHCIANASAALNTDYEFMAEAPSCGSSNCQLCHDGTVFSGANFIIGSANLDYALVQITSGNPALTYGYLKIDNRDAVVGEQIYIPQHPSGRAKELGLYSTHSSDAGGVCRVYSITRAPCSGSGYNDVGYYCDTEGGSSGSPVLASSSHKVIALHHCANCPNRGVPIDLVYAQISRYILVSGPVCGDGTCDSGEHRCNCAADCGMPPSSEDQGPFCQDHLDNDCDGLIDCVDSDCSSDSACTCIPRGGTCSPYTPPCCSGSGSPCTSYRLCW